jgi:hypothetical protein
MPIRLLHLTAGARARATSVGISVVSFMACTAGSGALVPSNVDTSLFDGHYEVMASESFPAMRNEIESEADEARKQTGRQLVNYLTTQYRNFRVHDGVIRSGTVLVREISLVSGKLEGSAWRGKAVMHEDIGDPGDTNEVELQLTIDGDRLEFAFLREDGTPEDPIVLRRTAK